MASPQPSLLVAWKKRMMSVVRQYLKAKAILDTLPDSASDDDYAKARDRERLLRGVVRGSAQMYIILVRPYEADSNDAINDLEIDFGMPGKRSRAKAQVSETVAKFMEDYYED
jgi:hypothetical protein